MVNVPGDDAAADPKALDAEEGDGQPPLDEKRAFEVLEIRTPLEEFEAYVRARVATLAQLGEAEKADTAMKALELGRRALARVTGAAPAEGAPAKAGEGDGQNGSAPKERAR